MDEMTRSDRDPGGSMSPGPHDVPAEGGEPEQAKLPFDQLPAVPLPFHDEADEPIGFALTARARRKVAPATLPPLSIVDGATEDDPTDTRPSRARALRRAGADVADIARQLRVDELLVRAWAGDVAARADTRRASGAARAAEVLAAPAGPSGSSVRPDQGGEVSASERRLRMARRDAVDEGRRRLAVDADFAAGVGLLAGLVHVDRHSVNFQTDRPELAARVLAWSTEQAGADRRDVRIVLRLGSTVAGDLARHRWASVLGIGREQIAFTRGHHAVGADAVEALVRIPGPEVAARVDGWCEALLQPAIDPADVAF
jgi:hypothetical protein